MNRRTYPTVLCSLFLLIPLLASTPLTAAEPIDVIESEAGFYYTVQKGDTLWDLSRHFNDSPWLWPELWEENDQISNPHWIFPGERIRLYKKSGTQAITKTEPIQQVAVLPAEPVAQKEEGTPAAYFAFAAIDSVGFIRSPPVTPLGTIFEVQGRKILISEEDMVYIRPTDNSARDILSPGSRHTVFRYMNPTDERDSKETIGTQHYILGIVEVARKEQDMVIAKIIKSFRTIGVNDLLMPFIPRLRKIELKPGTPGIDGQVIISENHSTLIGDHTLAFIDKGRTDNIVVGQQYSIYNAQKMVLENNEIETKRLPPVDIGTLLILHTEQTTSTVVITRATKNIARGERFRTPLK